jgi:hypothetical protein
VTLAEAGSRFQVTGYELFDSFQGCNFAVDHEWLDPVLVEIVGGSPSHAETEHGVTVLECCHNAGVAVRLVMMPVLAITIALGVGRKCVGTNRAIANVLTVNVENEEALRSAEMMRDGYTVCGSNCYLHANSFQVDLRGSCV